MARDVTELFAYRFERARRRLRLSVQDCARWLDVEPDWVRAVEEGSLVPHPLMMDGAMYRFRKRQAGRQSKGESGPILGRESAMSARLRRLAAMLESGESFTAASIEDGMGASNRTVKRDIERLRSLGWRIHFCKTEHTYKLARAGRWPELMNHQPE